MPCCVQTPALQLPSREAIGRASAFENLSLPVCALGMVPADFHRAMASVEKYVQH